MPKGNYVFISLHNHSFRREILPNEAYTDISVGSLVELKSIHNVGLATELDYAGYGKPPIEIYDSYENVPEIIPAGQFLVIEADVPMGRYWIPVVAIQQGDKSLGKYRGQFCIHF